MVSEAGGCTEAFGEEMPVARMGSQWAQQPPAEQHPGQQRAGGAGEGSAGRQALGQSSSEEQTHAAGCCRQGFPEVHVTPRAAPGTDRKGWPRSAQGAWLCSPPAAQSGAEPKNLAQRPRGTHHQHGNPSSPQRALGPYADRQESSTKPSSAPLNLPLHPHHRVTKATTRPGRGVAPGGMALGWSCPGRVAQCPW